jgi:hypothetical protein
LKLESPEKIEDKIKLKTHKPVELDKLSEVSRSLLYMHSFFEEELHREKQVLSLSYPKTELQMFIDNLETIMQLIRKETSYIYIPTMV